MREAVYRGLVRAGCDRSLRFLRVGNAHFFNFNFYFHLNSIINYLFYNILRVANCFINQTEKFNYNIIYDYYKIFLLKVASR